jgi:hypothetical protein
LLKFVRLVIQGLCKLLALDDAQFHNWEEGGIAPANQLRLSFAGSEDGEAETETRRAAKEGVMSENANLNLDRRNIVVRALEDPKYEWRTVEGVAEQTGLEESNVRETLEELNGEIIRSSIPDESGRNLYTTRRHYRETQGLGTRILNALSDKVA